MSKMEINYLGDEKTEITHLDTNEKLITDLPKDNGGRGRNFSPTDLLAASMGSCIVTIMAKMATRDGYEIAGAKIIVDKEMSKDSPRRVAKLTGTITFPNVITEQQKKKLMAAVKACPVHNSLHPDIVVDFQVK